MGLTVVPGNMIEDGTVTDSNFTNTTITSTDMALDPRNASNMSSGDVPLAQLGNIPAADLSGLDDDIALLGFKTAANGSLAKYNLLDQTVDAFEDASGVDAGASTNEVRNASKYYSGETTVSTGFRETITSTPGGGTWTAPAGATSVEVLVVGGGGGGGGGGGSSGGGGAGGVVYHASKSVTALSSYTVTIGTGGTCVSGGRGTNGTNSVFSDITALGGGGAGGRNSPQAGLSGGSGGGGGSDGGGGTVYPGGSGTQADSGGGTGYGNGGGSGSHVASVWEGGGGGGGAGAAGGNGHRAQPSSGYGVAGDGGVGRAYTIADGTTSVYYGGGGGGAGNTPASGGLGGGGDGGSGEAGTANTGGGGGGATPAGTTGVGGTGVVILSYNADGPAPANLTLVSNLTAAQAAPTKGDIVFTYTNGAGTAVINTNITAEISADNGSTWTEFTLASQGTTGGHTILTSHDQTITSTITAPWNMRYRIKTLVQSAAMDTRIQAVSLGWS